MLYQLSYLGIGFGADDMTGVWIVIPGQPCAKLAGYSRHGPHCPVAFETCVSPEQECPSGGRALPRSSTRKPSRPASMVSSPAVAPPARRSPSAEVRASPPGVDGPAAEALVERAQDISTWR